LAVSPTSRSLFLLKATTEGSKREPSAVGMTVGSPPSITATTLFVVPKSIPMIFVINLSFSRHNPNGWLFIP